MKQMRASIAMLSLVMLAGQAWAQNEGDKPAQAPAAEQPLKGPEVKDGSTPGERKKFTTPSKAADAKAAAKTPPMSIYVRALDVLRGDQAMDEVRLTTEQDEKFKQIAEEYTKTYREFIEKHREELTELRKEASENERTRIDAVLREARGQRGGFGGGPGGRGGRGGEGGGMGGGPGGGQGGEGRPRRDEMDAPPPAEPAKEAKPAEEAKKPETTSAKKPQTKAQEAKKPGAKNAQPKNGKKGENESPASARLRELYAQLPDVAATEAKIWNDLTKAQQPVFKAELDRLMKESEELDARRKAMMDVDLNRSFEEIMNDPNVPEQMKERLRNIPEDRREEALERMKDMQKRVREGGGPGGPGGGGPGRGRGGEGGQGGGGEGQRRPRRDNGDN